MAILEAAKSVAELARAYDKMDLYQKAVDLMKQVTELAHENFELKAKVSDLEVALKLKGALRFENNAYWLVDGGAPADGPFCSVCHDVYGKLVRMHAAGQINFCYKCKSRLTYVGPPRKTRHATPLIKDQPELG